MHSTTALAELDAAVRVAELERAVIAAEAAAGWNVPNARRSLTEAEFKAGVKFGDMQTRMTRAADALAAATDPAAEHVMRWLGQRLAGVDGPEAVLVLSDLASPATAMPIPGLAEVIADCEAKAVRVLRRVWAEAAQEARWEARRQNVNPPEVELEVDAATDAVVAGAAQTIVGDRLARLLRVALEAARRA